MREKISISQRPGGALRFLYRSIPGRAVLALLTRRGCSKLVGRFMDSRMSAFMIKRFIKKNNINMNDYRQEKYRSYNQFFTRALADGARQMCMEPQALISPCDSKLSAYRISGDGEFFIKGAPYTIGELLGSEKLAQEYVGGWCLIFRLAVDDYHRYCYFDDCTQQPHTFIKGILHTVQPIALERCNFYHRNCREYSVLRTEHFGDAVQVEVGAMMVGRICNLHNSGSCHRGEEKGRFEFGGSTVVLLLKANAAVIDSEITDNTDGGFETVVKIGERIGEAVN